MIARFNATAETALRKSFTSVARLDEDPVGPAFATLDDKERVEAVGLAIMIAGYVMVDVCDSRWPNQASVRQIAEDLATTGRVARQLQLDAGQIYEYLSQTVMGDKRDTGFAPDEQSFTRLAVIVAERALVVYCPKDMEIWAYLDQIESAIETAWALGPAALPAAVLRAYMPEPKTS
jgi:hypothetical protein